MSKYTTGEMAKLCGVSVRTVQYYDSRNILAPSELSEGGRRLYSEEDLHRLRVICFLRNIGMSIDHIGMLMSEDDPGSVISILLDQQEKTLREEIDTRQEQLDMLEQLKQELRSVKHFSVKSIGDIAYMMENKKKMNRVRAIMLSVGIVMDIIEVGTLILWINSGICWWPFAIGMCLVVALGIWISAYYFGHVVYICPKCHTVFKPKFKEAFWAAHTPRTRKLTCSHCGHKGFCVETYGTEEQRDEDK